MLNSNQNVAQTVLVLGDSHASVFEALVFYKDGRLINFEVVQVGGATASGLENPNSKTDAYRIFFNALESKSHEHVVLMLGEVDTGFVIWYRSQTRQISVEESLNLTIDIYTRFIAHINRSRKLIVVSTPLPTIKNRQDWGEIANYRKEVTATQFERTRLTIEFNSRVRQFCCANNIQYLSLYKQALGANGLLKDEFYSRDPLDHHYDRDAFRQLLLKEFPRLL